MPLASPSVAPLASRLAPHFSALSRRRGEDYFRDGAVSLTKASELFVLATVKGTRRYSVEVEGEPDAVTVSCTCPHFLDQEGNCKHLWATLLAAEKAGALAVCATTSGRLALHRSSEWPDDLEFEDDEEEEEDEDDEEGELRELPAPRPRAAPAWSSPGGRWKPPAPAWTALAQLAPSPLERRRGAPRERTYVVSVAGSLRSAGLAVRVETRNVSVNGVPMTPWRAADLRDARGRAEPAERALLALLIASLPAHDHGYHYGFPPSDRSGTCLVPPAFAQEVCRRLAGSVRAEVEGLDGARVPLHFDDGPAWTFELHADGTRRRGLALRGALRRGEARRWLSDAWLVIESGVVVFADVIASFDATAGVEWLEPLRAHGSLEVPPKEVDRFVAFALDARVPVVLPPELHYERVVVAPTMRLRLRKPERSFGAPRTTATLSFGYAEHEVPGEEPGGAIVDAATGRAFVRDETAERGAVQRLEALGFRASSWQRTFDIAPTKLPAAVRALVAEGWRVEGDGKAYRSASSFDAIVSSGIDWFDLRASARFGDEEVPLPRLLAALRRGDHLIALGDGTMGLLPEEWLARWTHVAAMGRVDEGRIRFVSAQAALLDALLASEPEVAFDERFAATRERLRTFEGIRPAKPPAGFRGELRDYQRVGLAWMRAMNELGLGGCLADDMGLGKTVQVLALLSGRAREPNAGPSLVVAPKSLVFNWRSEAARFAPSLRVLDHTGAERAAPGAHFADYDVVLTTYGTLKRDIAALRKITFDYAILDESQAIKNETSAAAKAARLVSARHRLALSGTPVENHLGELWSLFEFLNPGMLGAVTAFRRFEGARSVEGAERAILARAIKPFILRRTKSEVAKELPDRIEQVVHCALEKTQRGLYDELKAHYRAALLPRARREGVGKMGTRVLEALLRLRQAACHPGLLDADRKSDTSAKLDALLAQLDSVIAENHKAIVFSQFTSMLAIVRARLDEKGVPYEYLDGATFDRAARVERFQGDAECRVFLISLKAGGVGLNLTAAGYVFLLDPWWNPAVEAQAIDRAHRIGQTRTVFAYRLIATDTVEERVLELQQRKRELVEGLFAEDGAGAVGLRGMTAEDLETLLS